MNSNPDSVATDRVHSTPSGPRRRRFWKLVGLLTLVTGVFIADGSRRTPADPHRPTLWRGTASSVNAPSDRLRVATLNIHSARGRDRRTDLSRTAAVLEPAPDIAGLNEVRGTLFEPWQPDQAAQLGHLLSMESAFIPTERRWWHDHFGNGLLTRLPMEPVQRIPLVGTRGKAFRCAALSQFEFQNKSVRLLAVHVDSQADREAQLRAVISLFLGLQSPAILIGDLNSPPEDPQLKDLISRPDVADALHDVRTHRIDWILTRGFRILTGRLIENDASDHPAAVAELELIK